MKIIRDNTELSSEMIRQGYYPKYSYKVNITIKDQPLLEKSNWLEENKIKDLICTQHREFVFDKGSSLKSSSSLYSVVYNNEKYLVGMYPSYNGSGKFNIKDKHYLEIFKEDDLIEAFKLINSDNVKPIKEDIYIRLNKDNLVSKDSQIIIDNLKLDFEIHESWKIKS